MNKEVRKSVVMFADYPPEISPSLWINGTQLKTALRDLGWDLEILPPFSATTTHFISGVHGLARLYLDVVLPLKRYCQIRHYARKTDIFIVHKSITTMSTPPRFERLLRRIHPRIIYNFDDAVHERGIPYLDERIGLADAVWVGNTILVEYSRQYCSDVRLIESAVDCDHYRPKFSYGIQRPLRLFWSGTPFGQKYLHHLHEPLRELRKKVDFIFTVVCRERFTFDDPSIPEEWVPFSRENELRYLHEADIALMPLDDGPYERAKENYKVKMYLACGLPVVCSPVGINLKHIIDGERGFFAADAAAWVDCILRLIQDEVLRRRFGEKGHRFVTDNYSIPIVARKVADLFISLSNGNPDDTRYSGRRVR